MGAAQGGFFFFFLFPCYFFRYWRNEQSSSVGVERMESDVRTLSCRGFFFFSRPGLTSLLFLALVESKMDGHGGVCFCWDGRIQRPGDQPHSEDQLVHVISVERPPVITGHRQFGNDNDSTPPHSHSHTTSPCRASTLSPRPSRRCASCSARRRSRAPRFGTPPPPGLFLPRLPNPNMLKICCPVLVAFGRGGLFFEREREPERARG